MTFYTYMWLRQDGVPFYVGKGTGRRAYQQFGHRVHKPTDVARIMVQEHATEQDAYAAEIFLIEYYGRLDLGTGCLANLTAGGEGGKPFLGHRHSGATLLRMSAWQKDVPKSAAHKARIGVSNKGKTKPTLLGNTHTLGKHWTLSEETRGRMCAAAQARTWSTRRKTAT